MSGFRRISGVVRVRHPGKRFAACVWTLLALLEAMALAQGPGAVQARIHGHIAAGEFAPALALANAIPQRAARDSLLAAIAQAQARGGARNAALATLRGVQDDRLRTYALDQMTGAVGGSPAPGAGAAGGATLADFDTLIDLITTTIAPQSWDTVGGPGAIDSFPTGVYVDSSGLMRRAKPATAGSDLAELRDRAQQPDANRDVRRESVLRKVSLTRLERHAQDAWARGQAPTQAMKNLAGLHRIQYVFLYPESRDIVIAGPAGAWAPNREGRPCHIASGEPMLQLDDFVVVLRNARHEGGRFTCSITPRRENLAAAQAYLNESAKTPLKAGQRDSWLAKVRSLMGRQDITVQGLDPQTRAARVIVEADYRMKLVGMGLEEGVLGVTSYLSSVTVPEGGAPPPMTVLRWWFTMNYEALRATPGRDAFELRGPGVRVLSENEMLTQRGERIHTGQADEWNEQFAHSFTKHFAELAAKYPIYADLRNVFDLALVAALIVAEDVPNRLNWPAIHFVEEKRYQVERGPAPTEVETVLNHRIISQKHIVAGVSGGVSADARPYVQKPAIAIDNYGALQAGRIASMPSDQPDDAWWWD
ncbi:MAG TPA: DUF1598 domain-containing protein [Candidatus Anammoximicrobium sp.]|nr:DUF1598 domain-containing protein [Candidatus Anammoximicrobium sp.]